MVKRFRIDARLHCQDIRLSTEVSIIVTQEERPIESQARGLIWAKADEILVSEGAGDCFAELLEVRVTGPLSSLETKLVLGGRLSYAEVKERFAALWPKLNLELFLMDHNFYREGGDPYASLLKDTDPLHIWREGSGRLTIHGDMLADNVCAQFEDVFWLQAWVTVGDRGPRIPPELSLDAANDEL